MVIGAVAGTCLYLRYRARQETQKTIRHAMERGQKIMPELLETLGGEIAERVMARIRRRRLSAAVLAVALGLDVALAAMLSAAALILMLLGWFACLEEESGAL